MLTRLISFSLKKPLTIYWLLALLTFGVGSLMVKIQIDTDPENMLAQTEPARVYHNQVKSDFLLSDILVVGAVVNSAESIFNQASLNDLKTLSDQILAIDGVKKSDVNSLSTIDNIEQGGEGVIRFEWMMNEPVENEQQAGTIGQKASRLPFVVNSLVSGDQKAATIYVPIFDKNQSFRIASEIKANIAQLSKANLYYITGLPVAEDTFGYEMFVQMGISAPTAALVIYLLMLYFFRSAALVIAPMVVAMSTVIVVMGAMIGMGYTVHIMSSMIAIFLMPIAVVDSVHLMSEFTDSYAPGKEAKQVMAKITRHLFQPMLFTSITSAAGFFSLALTPIPPVQIFGIFVGSGVLLAFVVTVVFIPAYVSRMSEASLLAMQSKLHQQGKSTSLLVRMLPGWGRFSRNHAKLVLGLSLLVVVVSVVGMSKIEVNDNPVRWFKADHEIRVADRVLNQHFAGTYDAHLVFDFTGQEQLLANWKSRVNHLISTQSEAGENEKGEIQQAVADFLENHSSVTTLPFQDFNLMLDDLTFSATLSDQQLRLVEQLVSETEKISSQSSYFTSPEVLSYIESLQAHLLKSGKVGKSNSVVDLVKTVNRELISGHDGDFALPETQAGVAQTLLQFQSSHRPQDLWHFITPSYDKTLIWLQMTSGDNKDMAAVIGDVAQFVQSNPLPQNVSMNWAGKAYLNLVWQDKMVAGMQDSLLSAFVMVFIMMVVLFRSIIFGLLAMLPLTITITFMYGMIGWLGKYYDMPIAVLSALTLGLSVDFAIHFIERVRAIYAETQSWEQTVEKMFQEPARAISRNALVIALGFTPLLLAPLVPYITVGAFLATIMAVSALVTLFLLPASLEFLKRWLFD